MVGERLRALRKARGLTQEALERASGVNQTTISGIENGKVPSPTISTMTGLAQALSVPLHELTGERPAEPLSEEEWAILRDAVERLDPSDRRAVMALMRRVAASPAPGELDLRDLDADERQAVMDARPELRPVVADALRRLREIDRGQEGLGERAEQQPHSQARRARPS